MPDQANVVGLKVTQGLLDTLNAWLAALLAAATLQVKLFQNNNDVGEDSTLNTLTEANYSGYAPISVTTFLGAYLDSAGDAYATTQVLPFTCNGQGVQNTIYSAGLCQSIAGGTAATATSTVTSGALTSVTPSGTGTGYQFRPRVVVTGGGGIGAVVTANIVNGGVASYNIVNPGTGYATAPTITVDPPLKLVDVGMLPSPVVMAVSTDAIPLTLTLQENN